MINQKVFLVWNVQDRKRFTQEHKTYLQTYQSEVTLEYNLRRFFPPCLATQVYKNRFIRIIMQPTCIADL